MTDVKISTKTWTEEELRENVGQLFIVGFHGQVASEDIKTLITTHKVGTIIFFQRNISTSSQLLTLTQSLQKIAKEAGHSQPLFIGIDQENGLVTRIREPVAAQLPGPMTLAATGDASNAYRVASATAETLKHYGINFNYAPIADVNSEPKNPVIGVRSPSDDPEIVGRIVSAQVKGLKEGGVVPCVKHFPGHGDTAVDSHLGLPIIPKTKVQLDVCELVPFRRAVVEGVDAIMTAHIALPNLGHEALGDNHPLKQLPASLNPEAICILREEMKYEGLIVSDCLEMDGVRAKYGTEKSAVMALKAGTDCVMICHTMAAQVGAIDLVVEAVKSGDLSQDDIAKSLGRVRALKSKYLEKQETEDSVDFEEIFARHLSLASGIYAKSTTVVRHDPSFFPLSKSLRKIVLITPGESHEGGGAVESGDEDKEDFVAGPTYTSLIEDTNPGYLEVIEIKFQKDTPLSPESEKVMEQASAVILATRNATLSAYQKDLGLSLGKKLGSKLIVIATCEPSDFLAETEEIKNYLALYEPTIPAFKAAIDVIFGVTKATGALPVGIAKSSHDIQILSNSDSEGIAKILSLWQQIFPSWSISLPRLTKLLHNDHGRYFLHDQGFCLAYLFDDGMGKIPVIGVLPEFRGKGLGTALITKAREGLKQLGEVRSFGIGSVFPRFWAGMPFDIPQEHKDFFLHRGFHRSTKPTARDLYRDITLEVAPPAILEKVSSLPLTFSPWSPELYEECMTKQVANFGNNKAWINAYLRLASNSQHHEVMVAFSPTGEQVGWTLMCSSSSVVADDFAFLPLCPSGENTGLIACVGVDKSARGKGVGLALLVRAMEDLRRRGMKGVLIDWVVIRGFYETLGFNPIWEYDAYDW